MKVLSKTICLLFLIIPIAILLISVSAIEASQLKIEVAGVGSDVQNRTLLEKGSIFKEGSTVFFFTKVTGGEAGDMINHVWIHEDLVKASREAVDNAKVDMLDEEISSE